MVLRAGKIFTFGMMVFLFFSYNCVDFASADISDALSFFENAENTIGIAVKTLSELQDAKVDVSQLVPDLNEASKKIAESQLAIKNQEYELSKQLSEEAQEIAINVISKASSIREQRINLLAVLDQKVFRFLIETAVVSLAIYLFYRYFEKKFIYTILNSTIEVKKDES